LQILKFPDAMAFWIAEKLDFTKFAGRVMKVEHQIGVEAP
jgi:hypothetical protein